MRILTFSHLFYITIFVCSLSIFCDYPFMDDYFNGMYRNDILNNEEISRNFDKEDMILVSLGDSCNTAYQIKLYGKRVAAFPFDWNLTPTNGLIKIFEDEFKDFFNIAYLSQHPFFSHSVLHTLYNITFAHDFPVIQSIQADNNPKNILVEDWQKYVPKVQKKYVRRIERFNNLKYFKGKVFFIYTIYPKLNNISLDQALYINTLLKNKFADLDFELVIIQIKTNSETYADWHIKDIKQFDIYNYHFYSAQTEKQFKAIFDHLISQVKIGEHKLLDQ